MRKHGHSQLFSAPIGQSIDVAEVAIEDRVINADRYDYEGNWVFARFDSDIVYGARFGFGRGQVDLADYGLDVPPDPSFLMIHIELMTCEGAMLWLGTGLYQAHDVVSSPSDMEMELGGVFDVRGWPTMRWKMNSDDDWLCVDLRLDLRRFVVLPDNVMPNNLFAMWVSVGDICGTVRYGGRQVEVRGCGFYDHPRINVCTNDVPAIGWYLYMPVRFDCGATLIAYYTQDANGCMVARYSFGVLHDSDGRMHWLNEVAIDRLSFDSDGKPSCWTVMYSNCSVTVRIDARVRPTAICRVWGGPGLPGTRSANGNMPLIFDVVAAVGKRSMNGGGLAEYIVNAKT